LQALKNPPFEGRVFRESFTRLDSLVLDSHQRLLDVADNTVVYSQVISSYAGQGDNRQVVGIASSNTSGSASSNLRATEVLIFDNDLGAGIGVHEEVLENVVVTSCERSTLGIASA
jgi:hypothetical protein